MAAQDYVFISYSRINKQFVSTVTADLQEHGINVWIDKQGLKPGTRNWEQALRDAIQSAFAVLLVASSDSRKSNYVQDEIAIAEMYNCPIYPIWAAGAEWMDCVPMGMGRMQYVDLRADSYNAGLKDVIQALEYARENAAAGLSGAAAAPGAALADVYVEEVQEAEPGPSFVPRNPYKGLRAFTRGDARDFFGRQALISTLLERIQSASQSNERLLAVVGPSGSGKSSLVMAGLLPALQTGSVPGGDHWFYLPAIVPSSSPLTTLALTLAKMSGRAIATIQQDLSSPGQKGLDLTARLLVNEPGARVVLIIDQFEELFTLTTSEAERQRFVDLITTAVTEPDGPLMIILTMRADFYDRPMNYGELGQLIKNHTEVILPMSLADLRDVIERPATLDDVRLHFEDGLVAELVFEVREQPGGLPLLQFTLDQLFERREGLLLTWDAYRAIGGLRGALAKHAEATYAALSSDEHRHLARALFLRLIEPGATEQDTARRRAALSELVLADEGQTVMLRSVADSFIWARLLTTSEINGIQTIEVSHEALIREWQPLRQWLEASREEVKLHGRLMQAVNEWIAADRDSGFLARETPLAQYETLLHSTILTLSGDERAFLEASLAQQKDNERLEQERATRERQLERRALTRLRWLVAGLTVFLVSAVILSIWALDASSRADTAKATSVRQVTSVVDAMTTADWAKGIAIQQAATSQLNAQRAQVKEAAARSAQSTAVRSADEANSQALAADAVEFTREGDLDLSLALVISANNIDQPSIQARRALYDAAYGIGTRRLIPVQSVSPATQDTVDTRSTTTANNVIYTPDGQSVIFDAQGELVILDARTGHEVRRLRTGEDGFYRLVLSPDQKSIFGAVSKTDATKTDILSAGPIMQYDLVTGKEIARFTGLDPKYMANKLLTSHDGRRLFFLGSSLASDDDSTAFAEWDIASRQLSRQIPTNFTSIYDFDIDPADTRLAVTGQTADGSGMVVLDLNTLKPQFAVPKNAARVAISPDGSSVLTTGNDGLRIWNLATGQQTRFIRASLTDMWRTAKVVYSPDGKNALTASSNGILALWNLADGQLVQRLKGHIGFNVNGVAFSPDSLMLVSVAADRTIRFWDLASAESPARFALPGGARLAFNASGQVLTYRLADGNLVTQDLVTSQIIRRVPVGSAYTAISAVAPNQQLALLDKAGNSELVDLNTGEEIRPLATPFDAQFSSDSSLLILVSTDGVIVQDAVTGDELARHKPADAAQNLVGFYTTGAISPDRQSVLVGTYTGKIYQYSLPGWNLLHTFAGTTNGMIGGLAFSPDGQTALSGTLDGQVMLWSLPTGETLHTFAGQDGLITSMVFSPDGQTAASTANVGGGEVKLWYIPPYEGIISWLYANRYVRELSCEERRLYNAPPRCTLTGYFATRTPNPPPALTAVSYAPPADTLTALPSPTPTLDLSPTPTLSPTWTPTLVPLSAAEVRTLASTMKIRARIPLEIAGMGVRRVGQIEASQLASNRMFALFQLAEAGSDVLESSYGDGLDVLQLNSPAKDTRAYAASNLFIQAPLSAKTVKYVQVGTVEVAVVGLQIPGLNLQMDVFVVDGTLVWAIGSPDTIPDPAVIVQAISGAEVLTPVPTVTPIYLQAAQPGSNRATLPTSGHQVWTYQGRAGELLTLRAKADHPANHTDAIARLRQNLVDTEMIVRGPDGQVLAHAGDIEQGVLTDAVIRSLKLPSNGSYEIEVYNYNPPGGGYTLVLDTSRLSTATPSPFPTPSAIPTITLTPTSTLTTIPAVTAAAQMSKVWSAAYSADGTRLVTNSDDKAIRVWDAHTGQLVFSVPGFSTTPGRFSPDGKLLATCNIPNFVQVWDAKTGKLLATLNGHTDLIRFLLWNQDGTQILTASSDHTARVWDAQTGAEIHRLVSHLDAVITARWSPDETRIVTAGYDNNVLIWNADSGQELQLIHIEHPAGLNTPAIEDVTWSPDGKQLAIAGASGVSIWDAATATQVLTLKDYSVDVYDAAWNQDGTRLLTNATDQTVRVWDADTGGLLFTLADKITKFSFTFYSPDEAYIASRSEHNVLIWNARTGDKVRSLTTEDNGAGAFWSPDGQQISVSNDNGTVQIFDLNTSAEVLRLH